MCVQISRITAFRFNDSYKPVLNSTVRVLFLCRSFCFIIKYGRFFCFFFFSSMYNYCLYYSHFPAFQQTVVLHSLPFCVCCGTFIDLYHHALVSVLSHLPFCSIVGAFSAVCSGFKSNTQPAIDQMHRSAHPSVAVYAMHFAACSIICMHKIKQINCICHSTAPFCATDGERSNSSAFLLFYILMKIKLRKKTNDETGSWNRKISNFNDRRNNKTNQRKNLGIKRTQYLFGHFIPSPHSNRSMERAMPNERIELKCKLQWDQK